jgi:hypothetical protein
MWIFAYLDIWISGYSLNIPRRGGLSLKGADNLLMEHDSGEWRPWLRFDPAALVDELSHTHRDYGVNGGFSKRKGLSASPARVLGGGGGREGGRGGPGDPAALAHGPRSTVHSPLGLELELVG